MGYDLHFIQLGQSSGNHKSIPVGLFSYYDKVAGSFAHLFYTFDKMMGALHTLVTDSTYSDNKGVLHTWFTHSI